MYTPLRLLLVVVLNAVISVATSASLIAEAETIAVHSASKTMADLDYVVTTNLIAPCVAVSGCFRMYPIVS
jgi:hypothetical protein